jgi:hypothetical protein
MPEIPIAYSSTRAAPLMAPDSDETVHGWGTEDDQIQFGVITTMAAKFFVVNLQLRSGAARLASPAVTTQNFLPELMVLFGIKPESRLFGMG